MSYQLTDEQKAIVNTIYNDEKVIKINAYAGAAKTTSILECIKEIRKNDKKSKILYLVFNRSMIQDSKAKFDSLDLNVDAYTTHGFALGRFTAVSKSEVNIMSSLDYSDYMKVKNKDFKYKYCKYKNIIDMLHEYCTTYDNLDTFCNNMIDKDSKEKYGLEENYIKTSEVDFFKELYQYFLKNNKYTHSMYLKEYACNCKDLIKSYKYIFIDEAQDISSMALLILKRARCDKMYLVGDSKQKIYSFLKTVDVFDKFDGKVYPLSTSFRFNDKICKMANDILCARYEDFKSDSIKNFHNIEEIDKSDEKTILFRKNVTLFEYATRLISENDNIKVKFMDVAGGDNTDGFDSTFSEALYFYDKLLESMTFGDEGNNEKEKIILEKYRNTFNIKRSKNIDQFVKIAEKEGIPLYRYLYFNKSILPLDTLRFFNFFLLNEHKITEVLEKVRDSENCIDYNKFYILITSHRAKGLEWSHVKIAEDSWNFGNDDEANLCYVAVTRAKHRCDCEPILRLLEEKYSYAK